MGKKSDSSSEDRVYKRIDLVGVSPSSFEAAVESAVKKASRTLKGLRWFEIKEMRGAIAENEIREYQVVITVSFEVK